MAVIEDELDELRRYVAYFDNTPGPEPTCSRSDIQEALRPVLTALEKLASTCSTSVSSPSIDVKVDRWIDGEGDVWTRGKSVGSLYLHFKSGVFCAEWTPEENGDSPIYREACTALWPDFVLPDA